MRETRSSGSVEGVMSNRDPYSDCSSYVVRLPTVWNRFAMLSAVKHPPIVGRPPGLLDSGPMTDSLCCSVVSRN
jgi:hypothetical protein